MTKFEYLLIMRQPVCVFCRSRPADPAWRPFCSERCKVRDLARWADESYRVSGETVSDGDSQNTKENN